MDATYAFLGSCVTAAIGGVVAIVTTRMNARAEKQTAAELAAAATLEQARAERLTLRDEQLAACEKEKAELRARLVLAERTNG